MTSKYDFDIHDLTQDSMAALHRQIEIVDTLMRNNKENFMLDSEYKEVLSYLMQSMIKIEDVLDTIIYEVSPIKLPWYKRLFHR